VLTWVALPIGIIGGLAIAVAPVDEFGATLLLAGALLIGISTILDGLDGPLARRNGMVTRWGDYLDHTFDRLLDGTWIVCIAASPFVGDISFGLVVAWFTLLGSYMGTQAQAVAGTRNYRGFGRADRTIMSIVALILTALFVFMDAGSFGYFPSIFDHIEISPMSIVLIISGIGGIYTFLVRFVQASQGIKEIDRNDPLPQPNQEKSE
jgi:archaetidylinositol phosphate synthase